jgi:predicted nucleic acid-binding protein
MESAIARTAIEQLQKDGHELLVSAQNQAEFWNVATRPKSNNGYGLTIQQTNSYLGLIEQAFPLITETEDSHHHWRKLVMDFNVLGVKVHDARLVAVMLEHGVERILTFNDEDFRRYEPAGITAVHPQAII